MRSTYALLCGDVLDVLARLPPESVDCVVTSPPYWGLRDYGMPEQLGLEPTPEAYVERMVVIFREVRRVLSKKGTLWLNLGDSYFWAVRGSASPATSTLTNPGRQTEVNGAPIDKRPRSRRTEATKSVEASDVRGAPNRRRLFGLKHKDLVGIPWRVAFALQADGWWLRSDIIWSKPNPMPESIKDRPTRSHEFVFLLTKSARYFYDADAIREPYTYNGGLGSHHRNATGPVPSEVPGCRPHTGLHRSTHVPSGWDTGEGGHHGRSGRYSHFNVDRVPRRRKGMGIERTLGRAHEPGEIGAFHPLGRNKRSVWMIATAPYRGAHFSTFPPALVRPCILAGCPKGGMVLDPFVGSGTTVAVALALGRNSIGVDIKSDYLALARRRITSGPDALLSTETTQEVDA